jgi:uncharacterized membrane protein YdjX (TVP38/TMEM64 family)
MTLMPSPEQAVAAAAGPAPAARPAVAWIKMGLLLAFAAAAVLVYRYTEVGRYLSKDAVRGLVLSFGALGPAVHIFLYAASVTAFVPATVMSIAGAIAFGKVVGAAYNVVGAVLGATASFLVGRYLGRDLAARLIRGRLQELDAAAERNGFSVIFYLRMAYFPFVPLNYGAGLTRIRFRDFFWGTALGIIPGTFIFTYFLDEVTNIGSAGDLLKPRFLFPLALFAVSFLIPVGVRRVAARWFPGGPL